jgi:two-component system alkaline phosphatase synthesis response regulator PhoP
MAPRPTLLIIEDNADTRRFLEIMLGKEFEIVTAENGVIGVDFARNKSPDLVLLDIMLPVLNGYDTCSLLKKDEKTKNIPIIFLSAKNTLSDIRQGLQTGADDYLPKPFDYKELLARIKARIKQSGGQGSLTLQLGPLKIESSDRTVTWEGKPVDLTLTDFDLLRFLATRAGTVVSRENILAEVWKGESKQTNHRTIDVHVRALRKKIPALVKHVISIYGVGYKFEKP